MAKGRIQVKSKKNDTTPASTKSTKSNVSRASTANDKSVDKLAITDTASCVDCECHIGDDTRALNCDKCGKFWKCSGCVGIRASTYDDLVTEAGKELHWFCKRCHEAIFNPINEDNITAMLFQLTQHMQQIEQKIDTKVDVTRVAAIEDMVKGIDNKISEGYDGVVKSLEQSRTDVTAVLERSKLDVSAMQGCVEGVLRVQSREEKEEEEEKKRRKTNVIIHGLSEPTAVQSDDRRNEDYDQIQELLHTLSCDEVSVNHITRLGPPTDECATKPRPVKLDLASEEARNYVLKHAKNLRATSNDKWKKVFLHQDLTPKERDIRRGLVQQLKLRKANGEQNLIIVNGKIIKKMEYTY